MTVFLFYFNTKTFTQILGPEQKTLFLLSILFSYKVKGKIAEIDS